MNQPAAHDYVPLQMDVIKLQNLLMLCVGCSRGYRDTHTITFYCGFHLKNKLDSRRVFLKEPEN